MTVPHHAISPFTDLKKVSGVSCLGNGHINDTYLVSFVEADRLPMVLQRVNHRVFPDVPGMMANIRQVTDHQHRKLAEWGRDQPERRALRLLPTLDDRDLFVDEAGDFWRAFDYIPEVTSIDVVKSAEQVFEAAKAFGEFQYQMADLPGTLLDTIPNFHHTPSRYDALESSVSQDLAGRGRFISAELAFARAHRDLAHGVADLMEAGDLPVRVTHNDTKINNILFDSQSGKGICVIDLDTVMTGSLLYDFGDLVRTATSLADEDEPDLAKIQVEMPLFEALLNGFLTKASAFIDPKELELLPMSGALISYELGMRFLKDYLDGDLYFKVAHPHHNLQRCRAQFRRAECILRLEREMTEMVCQRS
ncbi:aminoglycoside phosphotransferase family protein [Kiritimatiellaeota bacterium B1221]|nr:aminoglycoside phosphotransferase family protein [Kiritimatiellaeota bacterium B1221]